MSYQGLYHGYILRSNMSVMSVWPGINGENGLSGLWGGASNQREMISVKRRMHVSLLMTKWIGLDFCGGDRHSRNIK